MTSNSKCSTACAPTCSASSLRTATACASTFPSAKTGSPTSCAALPSAPPTWRASYATFCALDKEDAAAAFKRPNQAAIEVIRRRGLILPANRNAVAQRNQNRKQLLRRINQPVELLHASRIFVIPR